MAAATAVRTSTLMPEIAVQPYAYSVPKLALLWDCSL
jgi:hypothetical protein